MVEIQRTRIVAAMIEVSAERGTGFVTVSHIVERAGVSRRTFYELFKDREHCFLVAFDDALARAARYVLDAYEPEARWIDRTRMTLTGLLSFLDVEPCMGHLLIVGSLGAGAVSLERRRIVLTRLIALVDEGRTEAKAGGRLSLLTAEGIVGGVISVLHARLVEDDPDPFLEMLGPLMSMIVLPYLGPAAARRELDRPVPAVSAAQHRLGLADPLRGVDMRLTYRTVRVLMSVAAQPGSSNREIGEASEIQDQGQISKLLSRLARLGLIENSGIGQTRGAPNAWMLTERGVEIERAIGEHAAR